MKTRRQKVTKACQLFILWTMMVSLTQAGTYSGGTGEPNNPYQIATAQDLIDLGNEPNDYDKHFILTADIDLDPNLRDEGPFEDSLIAPGEPLVYWYDLDNVVVVTDSGAFVGTFDGNGHAIKNLVIVGHRCTGLFGVVGSNARIENLELSEVYISRGYSHGGSRVGALAGYIQSAQVYRCHTTGYIMGKDSVGGLVGEIVDGAIIAECQSDVNVSGEDSVGGLVGKNDGVIMLCQSRGTIRGGLMVGGLLGANGGVVSSCYSYASVNGRLPVGGLVGFNGGGLVLSSYSMGDVFGKTNIGGFVGDNGGVIISCYSAGTSMGEYDVGGLLGYNWGSVIACYSMGRSIADASVGGLVGNNNGGTVISSFWDQETSGQMLSAGGIGLSTSQMQAPQTYVDAGWDIVNEVQYGTCDFWILQDQEYPSLGIFSETMLFKPSGSGTLADPYLLTDANDLGKIWRYPLAHYSLLSDVDMSNMLWSNAVVPCFGGHFEGNGHVIHCLEIDSGGSLGLFGFCSKTSIISNLGVEDGVVNGLDDNVGGLVGANQGTILSSYSNVNICSCGDFVGGLVGFNNGGLIDLSYSLGTVKGVNGVGGFVGVNCGSTADCYSMSDVNGIDSVGGLVGNNVHGDVKRSFSVGAVTGQTQVNGLIGCNSETIMGIEYGAIVSTTYLGRVSSSFWDVETSGQAVSDAGEGLATTEMQDISTYLNAGWDFVGETVNGPNDIWFMPENDYPQLVQ